MNTLLDIFTKKYIVINSPARNKAEAFTIASDLFEKRLGITSSSVVHALNVREDLSSTALGSGIAIPHGIVAGINMPAGCLIKLARAIDFAVPDENKISILIFLLFPQITTHEHLQILSSLAQRLLDVGTRKTLISEQCPEKICQLLNLAIGFRESPKIQGLHIDFKQSIPSSNEYIISYLAEWAILEVSRKRYEKRVSTSKG
jgi:nitrogen PTS system EIIA component